jgi:predicted nucleotidyltransferase
MDNMDANEIRSILKSHKKDLQKKFSIKKIGLFGSYLKGTQNDQSDVDILVEFEEDAELSLFDLAGLEIELSALLGIKVDLVEKRVLKPFIGKHIMREVVYV